MGNNEMKYLDLFWDSVAIIGYCLVGILAILFSVFVIGLVFGLIGGFYWCVCYGLIFLFNLCGCGLTYDWMTMLKVFCGAIAFLFICKCIRIIFLKN